METLVQFFRDNWQFISTAIVALLTIIFGLLRKKTTIEGSFIEQVYSKAIYLINEAEKIFASGQGEKKKEFVIGCLKENYPNLSKLFDSYKKAAWSNEPDSSDVYSWIIENILSTPQKKQGKEK